ncbi:Tc toxin subunit A-related protein [Rhodococcus koreensis]
MGSFELTYYVNPQRPADAITVQLVVSGPSLERPVKVLTEVTPVERGETDRTGEDSAVVVEIPDLEFDPTLQYLAATGTTPELAVAVDQLTAAGVIRLSDIRRHGGVGDIPELTNIASETLRKLAAHADLARLTTDLTESDRLLDTGYESVAAVAHSPKHEFVSALAEPKRAQVLGAEETGITRARAQELHASARAQMSLLDLLAANDAAGRAGSMRPYSLLSAAPSDIAGIDNADIAPVFRDTDGAAPSSGCTDCESAVSPGAYLATLLDYAVEHVKSGTEQLSIAELAARFHQPIGELPLDCEASQSAVSQARIAIEVLRGHLGKRPLPDATHETDLAAGEAEFLFRAYTALLCEVGTTYDEIRRARTASKDVRNAIAGRLGISLTGPPAGTPRYDELDQLFRDRTAHADEETTLTEEVLERYFGLQRTTGDPLSRGSKYGDSARQLVRWRFSGAVPGRNTDQHGIIHLAIARDGNRYRVSAYTDEARTQLVAQGARSTPLGQVRLTPNDRSGLSGVVDLNYTADVQEDLRIRVAPYLLAWRLRHLWASWVKADHPDAAPAAADEGDVSPAIPIVDPQTIGVDDLRTARPGGPAYDLWTARTNALAFWRENLQSLVVEPSPGLNTLETAIGTALTMPGQVVQASRLRDLAKDQTKGEVIEPQLLQLGLTSAAFGFLMSQIELAEDGQPIGKSDWEALLDLLVVARKHRHFATWRAEEKSHNLTLSPNYFQIGVIERAPEAARQPDAPLWISTGQTRQRWVEVLQARSEQERTTVAGLESACNICEDVALPLLRDTLICAADENSLGLSDRAELLSRNLLIDMRLSESHRTTRVAQAIQTVQELLFRLRTGQLATMTPTALASVTAVCTNDGRTNLLATDRSGSLWMLVFMGSQWGQWQYCGALPGADDLRRASGITAVPQGDGFDIAVVGGDQALWLRRYRRAWQPWEKVPSAVAVLGDPALVALDSIDLQVFARVEQSQAPIFFQVWDGTSWTAASELFPSPWTAPAAVGHEANIHLIQEDDDPVGPSLAYVHYNGDEWTWDSPDDSIFRLSHPALIMSTSARLEIIDNHNGHMWHRAVEISAAANEWLPWTDLDSAADPTDPPLYGKPALVVFPSQAAVEGRVYAIRGTEGDNSVGYRSFAVTAPHTEWSSWKPGPGLKPNLTLQADEFDTEWRWLGSYATWRSAMFVLLYPDNLLLPSLAPRQTPAFRELVAESRPSRRITPADAHKLLRRYNDYLKDIDDLQVEATCEADDLRSSTQSQAELQHLFARTQTGKIYWSTFDHNAADPGYAQSFWKVVDLDTEVHRIVGATPWVQDTEDQHYIYLFFWSKDDSTWRLKRARFDLKHYRWETSTVDIAGPLPPGWNGAPVSWNAVRVRVVQSSRYETPRIALQLNQENGWHTYIRPLSPQVDGFAISPGDWNDFWILPYHGPMVGGMPARHLHAAIRTEKVDWIIYDDGPNLYIYANIPQRISTLITSNPYEFRGALANGRSSVYVFFSNDINTFYRCYSTDAAAGNYLKAGPAFITFHFDDMCPHSGPLWATFFVAGRRRENLLKVNSFAYILKPLIGNELVYDRKVQIQLVHVRAEEPPSTGHSVIPVHDRRTYTRRMYEENVDAPEAIVTYLREAFRLVPQQLGLALQASGEYVAALDWFCTVYDYRAPVTDRYIDYGLELDAELSEPAILEKPEEWLLDPLNPHSLAFGRCGAAARYAIATLVRCLNDFADAEFAVDTSESLPRVRALCTAVLELCDTAGFPSTAKYRSARRSREPSTPAVLLAANAAERQRIHQELLAQPAIEHAAKQAGSAGIAMARRARSTPSIPAIFSMVPYHFCIPPNPTLEELRHHAELNLQKLRAGRNIAGVRRVVPIYSAPTDAQTGVSVTVNGQLSPPGSRSVVHSVYRYSALISRAKELTQQAAQIESLFLASSEKRDQAAYRLFQARQEIGLAQAHVRLKDIQVSEARAEVKLTQLQTNRTLIQLQTYRTWISAGLNSNEKKLLHQYAELAGAQRRLADVSAELQQNETIHQSGLSLFNMNPYTLFAAGGAHIVFSAAEYAAHGRVARVTKEVATAQEAIQKASLLASYDRQLNEWRLLSQLAAQDHQIGKQTEIVALDRVSVAEQEKSIAETGERQARDTLEFLGTQFHDYELYDWMTGVLSDVYRSLLQHAAATLNTAYWRLAFERQELPPVTIQGDYWTAPPEGVVDGAGPTENGRRGLTGSARLLADLYQLDQFAFDSNRRKLSLTKTISLAQYAPTEFHTFRSTGILVFTTPTELFDRDFPGHYLRLIQRVCISVIGLIPPAEGIKALLTNSGISTVVVGPAPFQTVTITRRPETVALTLPIEGTGVFDDENSASGEMYLPFEGTGVDTTWEFRMPMAANRWDYQTLADVLFTVEYKALSDDDYRHSVIQRLDRHVKADRVFSLRNDYPDTWYDLANPELLAEEHRFVVHLPVGREDFPVNHAKIKLDHLAVHFVSDNEHVRTWTVASLSRTDGNGQHAAGPAGPAIDGVISTRRGNGEAWRQALLGSSAGDSLPTPIGSWELSLRSDNPVASKNFEKALKSGQVEDILLVLSYSGETPAWNASETY